MFKAINQETGADIIILDPAWEIQIDYLRKLDRRDALVCPRCKQPVRVRAGEIRIQHFAHKHLANCSYGHESPSLLRARRALYRWLYAKFGDQVTVEKELEDGNLSRPVDCWVDTISSPLAYWIIEVRMRPQDREHVQEVLEGSRAQVNWVFSIAMLNEDQENPDTVYLTTTERHFMQQSRYDKAVSGSSHGAGKSLHYLDYESEMLTTFRNLLCVHYPQQFQGSRHSHPLSEVLVLRSTGEFVHPGEHEAFQAYEEEQRRREELKRQRIEEFRRKQPRSPAVKLISEAPAPREVPVSPYVPVAPTPRSKTVHPDSPRSTNPEATCRICGRRTTNWVIHYGVDDTCECRVCVYGEE